MKKYKTLLVVAASLCLVAVSCAEPAPQTVPKAPQITVSTNRIVHRQFLKMTGAGFTPKQEGYSHLRRPNGTEFPVLPMLMDERGEFTHEIDTLLLEMGTHELWVVDSKTGVSSNVARFEVVPHQ